MSAFRTALGLPDRKPAPAARPRRDETARLVPEVAAALCRAERKELGADAFKQKYASPGACVRQAAEKATAIVDAASRQCATDENAARCMRAAIVQALGLPAPRRK